MSVLPEGFGEVRQCVSTLAALPVWTVGSEAEVSLVRQGVHRRWRAAQSFEWCRLEEADLPVSTGRWHSDCCFEEMMTTILPLSPFLCSRPSVRSINALSALTCLACGISG